jgi:hypothetical protein
MDDALRYRMLRQLVDFPDQMDADLDELIREAIENYRATAQSGAKSDENRSRIGRSIFARSCLECAGLTEETSRCYAHTAIPSQDSLTRQSSLKPGVFGNLSGLDFI